MERATRRHSVRMASCSASAQRQAEHLLATSRSGRSNRKEAARRAAAATLAHCSACSLLLSTLPALLHCAASATAAAAVAAMSLPLPEHAKANRTAAVAAAVVAYLPHARRKDEVAHASALRRAWSSKTQSKAIADRSPAIATGSPRSPLLPGGTSDNGHRCFPTPLPSPLTRLEARPILLRLRELALRRRGQL